MEHGPRKKHLLLNSETDASNEKIERKTLKKKEKRKNEKMKKNQKKRKTEEQ